MDRSNVLPREGHRFKLQPCSALQCRELLAQPRVNNTWPVDARPNNSIRLSWGYLSSFIERSRGWHPSIATFHLLRFPLPLPIMSRIVPGWKTYKECVLMVSFQSGLGPKDIRQMDQFGYGEALWSVT